MARAAVAEDLALAAAVRDAGYAVAAFGPGGKGPGISYRMYPGGLRDLAEGWAKNLAAGSAALPRLRAALVFTWVAGAAGSSVMAAAAVFGRAPGGCAVAMYGLFVAQVTVLARRAGQFHPAVGVCYPLPLAVFVLLFCASAFKRLADRPVRWRGRLVGA